jgi:hypothetical protein
MRTGAMGEGDRIRRSAGFHPPQRRGAPSPAGRPPWLDWTPVPSNLAFSNFKISLRGSNVHFSGRAHLQSPDKISEIYFLNIYIYLCQHFFQKYTHAQTSLFVNFTLQIDRQKKYGTASLTNYRELTFVKDNCLNRLILYALCMSFYFKLLHIIRDKADSRSAF